MNGLPSGRASTSRTRATCSLGRRATRPRLALEARGDVGRAAELREEDLERHASAEAEVPRLEHDAHPAAADGADDLVLASDRRPGLRQVDVGVRGQHRVRGYRRISPGAKGPRCGQRGQVGLPLTQTGFPLLVSQYPSLQSALSRHPLSGETQYNVATSSQQGGVAGAQVAPGPHEAQSAGTQRAAW